MWTHFQKFLTYIMSFIIANAGQTLFEYMLSQTEHCWNAVQTMFKHGVNTFWTLFEHRLKLNETHCQQSSDAFEVLFQRCFKVLQTLIENGTFRTAIIF